MIGARWREKHYSMLAGWLLAIVVLTGFGLSITGQLFDSGYIKFPAAVQIKTQAAADRIEGGVRGIDVSKWQGNINWQQVAKDNVSFAFIRATYGTDADPTFVYNAKEAHASGIKVGAYHYATFNSRATMLQQAKAFVEQLKKVEITYPVVLDIETHKGLSQTALTALSTEFMSYVHEQGYTVMLYSYQTFFERYLDMSALSNHSLWVANYIEQPVSIPHRVWQHTSYGTVKGINGRVDINIAYADLSVRRQVTVDKQISDSVKAFLNDTYSAGIDPSAPLDYPLIETWFARGLQAEINYQLGGNVKTTGEIARDHLDMLAAIRFTSETHGNITTIMQGRLFYKGYYTQPLTGHFDAHTLEALNAFRRDNRLEASGTMNAETWYKLFPPAKAGS